MTLPPDKTFRDKLLDYQKAAPPAAWDRIEKGLEGSGSKGIWLKVAAAVMVLAIPLFILWPKTQDESIAVTNSKHVVDGPVVAEEKSENILQTIEGNIEKQSEKNNSEVIAHQAPVSVKRVSKLTSVVEAGNPIKDDLTTEQTSPLRHESNEEESIAMESVDLIQKKSSMIVYSSEEVDARFLRPNKPTSKTVNETENMRTVQVEEKSDHFKILDVAAAIKNNQTSLGDLRQIKDEILSFDFLANNDKNNKK